MLKSSEITNSDNNDSGVTFRIKEKIHSVRNLEHKEVSIWTMRKDRKGLHLF